MDVDGCIEPTLDEVPRPLPELTDALRQAATSGDLRWVFEAGLVTGARERFDEHVRLVERCLHGNDAEGAWYALARAAEFVGYCRGVAASHFAAHQEVRKRDANKARLAQASRSAKLEEQNTEIATQINALPETDPAWRNWKVLEGAVSAAIGEHPGEIKETPGRIAKILAHPILASRVAPLRPPPIRRPKQRRGTIDEL